MTVQPIQRVTFNDQKSKHVEGSQLGGRWSTRPFGDLPALLNADSNVRFSDKIDVDVQLSWELGYRKAVSIA